MLHDLAKSDWQQLLRIPERFIRDGCLDRRHRGVWLGHDRSLAAARPGVSAEATSLALCPVYPPPPKPCGN
jgi:hypothetical protein